MFHNAIIRVGSFNDERYFYVLSFDRKSENEASVREILEVEIAVRSNIGDESKDTPLLLRR